MELTSGYLTICSMFTRSEVIEVPAITGGFMTIPSSEVSMSELLHILIVDSAKRDSSKFSVWQSLKWVRIGECEAYSAAAQWLLLRFRALIADHNRPDVLEAIYFWRFITGDQLRDLLKSFLHIKYPSYIEQADLKFALLQAQMCVSYELHPVRIVNETPSSHRMIHREKVALPFNRFVEVLD